VIGGSYPNKYIQINESIPLSFEPTFNNKDEVLGKHYLQIDNKYQYR